MICLRCFNNNNSNNIHELNDSVDDLFFNTFRFHSPGNAISVRLVIYYSRQYIIDNCQGNIVISSLAGEISCAFRHTDAPR